MTKKEARERWNAAVVCAAAAWRSEFSNQPLDPEWTGTAFEDIPSAVVIVLSPSDPWRAFHDAVDEWVSISAWRRARGLSQEALASLLPVSLGSLRDWEQRRFTPPPYLWRALRDLDRELGKKSKITKSSK